MADAAARREARRRRILENSENRLQRITGSTSSVREDACPDPTQSKTIDLFDQIYSEDQDLLIQSLSYDSHKRNVAREGSPSFGDTLELSDHTVRNEKIFPDKRQNNTVTKRATNESEREVDPHNTIDKIVVRAEASLLYSMLASRWTLILLAALVNVLYILQLQHFCGKTILAPFFGLLLVRLSLDDKLENRGGNILSAALILCNIKPELVYNFGSALRISKKIAEDFSIYIFSFVILYNVAYSYRYDTDTTTSAIDSENNELLQ